MEMTDISTYKARPKHLQVPHTGQEFNNKEQMIIQLFLSLPSLPNIILPLPNWSVKLQLAFMWSALTGVRV